VVVHGDDSIDKILRIFKKQVEKSGLMYDVKKRAYYSKPSVAKTLKSRNARKRVNKEKRKAGGNRG